MPGKRRGTVSFYYQYLDVQGGLFSTDITGRVFPGGYVGEDNKLYHGEIADHTALLDVDYGVFDRLAINTSIAYAASKYEGRSPHPALPGRELIDDGTYHPQFQDASVAGRYLAVSTPLAVIPFVRFTFPTHDYIAVGHSAVGRGLTQLQIGTHLARGLDPLLSSAYVKATLAYSFVDAPEVVAHHPGEPVPELNINKSFVSMELGYFVTTRFAVNGFGNYLHTEGGIDWARDLRTPDDYARIGHVHDAAARDRHTTVGGGLSFALHPSFWAYASFSSIVSGQNLHESNAFVFGTNWAFDTARRAATTP